MNTVSRTILLVVVIVMAAVGTGIPICSADYGDFCPGAAYQMVLDELVAENNLPGIAVGISFEGRCEWYGASGLANVDTGRAFEPDDYFRVASITKTFTATVVLQLIEEGSLSLEDTLAQWMSEYPDWSEITIRELLSHTSGIYDVTNDPNSDYFNGEMWPPAEIIALAATYPLNFEPGTGYGYSNVNYLILGKIIEEATGDTWAHQVRTRVSDPAGLSATYAESDEEVPGGLQVHGYWDGEEDLTEYTWPTEHWSAGSMVSTTADINHFTHAVFSGQLLEPATVTEMVTPCPFSNYGFGVTVRSTDAGPMYSHDGHVLGYRSIYAYFPDHAASYALFTNETNTDVWALSGSVWPLMTSTTSAIAASAHKAGAGNTSWVTDAMIYNPGSDPAYVELRYHQQGHDNTGAEGVAVRVEPNRSVVLDDLIGSTFDDDSSSGAVLVISSGPLLVTSRTYNDDPNGTFGQFIPAVPEDQWNSGTDPVTLLELSSTSQYRTNIGFANLGPDELDLTVDLFAADNTAIDTLTATLAPYSYDQLNKVFVGKAVVEDAYAVVRAGSEDARYLAFASVVDNATGDPTFIAPVTSSSEVLYVPGASHGGGVNGANWRTDLELFASGTEDAAYKVEWLPADADNTEPVSADFTLGSGHSVRYSDVVQGVFNASGPGALRVSVDAGEVMATSRTYNDQGNRTYGQHVPGFALNEALVGGVMVKLPGLKYSPDSEQGFHTNIGLVNASAEPMTVQVFIYGENSSMLGGQSVTLQPYSYHQETDIFAGRTDQDITGGRVNLMSTSSGKPYYAWASIVDNRSGDPVFIPAKALPTE